MREDPELDIILPVHFHLLEGPLPSAHDHDTNHCIGICRLEKAILNYVAFFAPTLDQELCRMPRLFSIPVQFSHKLSQPLQLRDYRVKSTQFWTFSSLFCDN